jgi:hypothetical protein
LGDATFFKQVLDLCGGIDDGALGHCVGSFLVRALSIF